MQATVADESEELKAELNVTILDEDVEMKPSINEDGDGPENGDGVEAGEGRHSLKPESETEAEAEEELQDPKRLPDDACETLYIQNLNEKVRIPGELHHHILIFSRFLRRADEIGL